MKKKPVPEPVIVSCKSCQHLVAYGDEYHCELRMRSKERYTPYSKIVTFKRECFLYKEK